MSLPRCQAQKAHLAALLAVLAAPPAWGSASNAIGAIRVEEGSPTRVVIQGTAAPTFTVFRLGQPPRVVVDLAGADVSGARVPDASRDGVVSLVTTSQFQEPKRPIGRVVVALNKDVPFDVKAEGNAVVVSLQTGVDTPVKAAQAAPAAETAPVQTAEAAPVAAEPVAVEGPPADKQATRLLAVKSTAKDSGAVLSLVTDGAVERYEVQEVANPARLVVDLYGIKQAPKKVAGLKSGPLSGVRIGKHETHVRVVLDARGESLPPFDVATSEEGVTVAFSARPAAAPAPAAAPETAAVTPAPAASRPRVEDVRFDDKGGFYRLKIALNADAAHTLTTDNPRLKVLELSNVELPRELERSLDTTAFSGPVHSVATFRDPDQPGVVKVAVDLAGAVEHRVWSKGNTLFWDFRAQQPRPAATAPVAQDGRDTRAAGYAVEAASLARQGAPAEGRYSGKRITIDLKDADILNVLRLIAEVSKLNIIASDEVKGTVTIKLRNVPWDQALDIILKVKGLGQERQGNIIRVVPQRVLQLEKEVRDAEAMRRAQSEPTVVKLLPVNYANAAEMLPQVQALLSPRGKATVDKRTNVIVVEDIRDNLVQAEKLVRTLDTQTPQVLIETRIIEASNNYSRSLGIQWGYGINMSAQNGNPTGLVFPYNIASAGGADKVTDLQRRATDPGIIGPGNYVINMPANTGSDNPPTTALGFSLGSIGDVLNLNLRLTAAESDGLVKIISSPKVATLDNKTAKISQGLDIPVARISAAGVQTQMVSAVLELEVTPHVTSDGSVLMKLKISNNQLGPTVQNQFTISKKEADTEVMVRDGETTVVGGIYTRLAEESYRKTPLLGNLPVVGWLFKAQDKKDTRAELLAFITPRIVNRSQAEVKNTDLEKR